MCNYLEKVANKFMGIFNGTHLWTGQEECKWLKAAPVVISIVYNTYVKFVAQLIRCFLGVFTEAAVQNRAKVCGLNSLRVGKHEPIDTNCSQLLRCVLDQLCAMPLSLLQCILFCR